MSKHELAIYYFFVILMLLLLLLLLELLVKVFERRKCLIATDNCGRSMLRKYAIIPVYNRIFEISHQFCMSYESMINQKCKPLFPIEKEHKPFFMEYTICWPFCLLLIKYCSIAFI